MNPGILVAGGLGLIAVGMLLSQETPTDIGLALLIMGLASSIGK